jgi:hypothetical protein
MILGIAAIVWWALAFAIWPQVSAAEPRTPSTAYREFAWIDLSDCRKPKARAPHVPPEDYEEYNLQRRYIALVPGRTCFIMDSFIERLGGRSSPGMRTLGARKYRFERGKWVEARMSFQFFPYGLRREQDGRYFYVEALLADDVMDGTIGRHWYPLVYAVKGEGSDPPSEPENPSLDLVQPAPGAVLQGLAVLLH